MIAKKPDCWKFDLKQRFAVLLRSVRLIHFIMLYPLKHQTATNEGVENPIDEEDSDVDKPILSSKDQESEGSVSVSGHMASTIALCLCTLTHSWLLISVFPYSGFMAIALIPAANEENAGNYAGLLASSFMLGRTLSSYSWGKVADIYGRVVVLQASLIMSCVFTLLFGLSRTFLLAMLWRFLLGFGNGVIGTAKTVVSELAKGDELLETRGMGLVMGMWGWGFLICPALGGALAEPVRQYPHLRLVQNGWIHSVLTKFPFLLPNVVGSICCLAALVAVSLLVEETLDSSQRRSARFICSDMIAWLRGLCRSCETCVFPWQRRHGINNLLQRKGGYQEVLTGDKVTDDSNSVDESDHGNGNDLTHESEHSRPGCIEISDRDEDDDEDALRVCALKHTESASMLWVSPLRLFERPIAKRFPSIKALRRWSSSTTCSVESTSEMAKPSTTTLSTLWSKRSTRNHLLVYWIYSFVSIQVDEAFPLFCISQSGGLGLSEDNIGKILSGSGVLFAMLQYFVYATIVNRYGLYPSIRISIFLGAPIVALIPFCILFFHQDKNDRVVGKNDDNNGNSLPWSALIFLSVVMAGYRILTNIFFSSITVATNRTVPAAQRASMNGLSMLGGSLSKACGPAFAGFLVAFCLSSGVVPQKIGGALIFVVIAFLGVSVAFVTTFLLKEFDDEAT